MRPLPGTPFPFVLARSVLRLLIGLNALRGFLILLLLVASLVWGGWVMRALGVPPAADQGALALGMRGIMVIGILATPLSHTILRRLLAVLESVRTGEPFVLENVTRLQTIAWAALGAEFLHIIVGVVAAWASAGTRQLDLGWSLSLTRPLAVLSLFVLARAFAQGTGMRDELAGTI